MSEVFEIKYSLVYRNRMLSTGYTVYQNCAQVAYTLAEQSVVYSYCWNVWYDEPLMQLCSGCPVQSCLYH